MFKKTTVLVGMALAILHIAPAVAVADWTDATVKVQADANITFSGPTTFGAASFGGITCGASHATATLTPGTTADINSFSSTVSSCTSEGGFAGCTVTSVTSTGLPLTIHTTGSAIEVTELNTDYTLHGAFCPYHEVTFKGNFTATPDNLHAMTKVTLSSAGSALEVYNGTTGATIAAAVANHSLTVTPSGTYGIT